MHRRIVGTVKNRPQGASLQICVRLPGFLDQTRPVPAQTRTQHVKLTTVDHGVHEVGWQQPLRSEIVLERLQRRLRAVVVEQLAGAVEHIPEQSTITSGDIQSSVPASGDDRAPLGEIHGNGQRLWRDEVMREPVLGMAQGFPDSLVHVIHGMQVEAIRVLIPGSRPAGTEHRLLTKQIGAAIADGYQLAGDVFLPPHVLENEAEPGFLLVVQMHVSTGLTQCCIVRRGKHRTKENPRRTLPRHCRGARRRHLRWRIWLQRKIWQ